MDIEEKEERKNNLFYWADELQEIADQMTAEGETEDAEFIKSEVDDLNERALELEKEIEEEQNQELETEYKERMQEYNSIRF